MVHSVIQQFQIPGRCRSVEPFGSGHIHDTYLARFDDRRYILQRLNRQVFPDVDALMENVSRVIGHLSGLLSLVPARDGRMWHLDADQSAWRCFPFLENTRSYDVPETPEIAREAARAFAGFQRKLIDLPPPRLHEVIPDFHHTPQRLNALEKAVEEDSHNRAATVRAEIGFALERRAFTSVLLDAGIPERVAHNDTKLNNVLMDVETGQARCVIDLDTVMPGLSLHDFGDLVRTAACRAPEDERDLRRMTVDLALFEALTAGYLSEARGFLTAPERNLMVAAGRLITLETGLRFLTDHLRGDIYFKVHRPDHNLERCRAQFALVADMERQEARLEQIVRGRQISL